MHLVIKCNENSSIQYIFILGLILKFKTFILKKIEVFYFYITLGGYVYVGYAFMGFINYCGYGITY